MIQLIFEKATDKELMCHILTQLNGSKDDHKSSPFFHGEINYDSGKTKKKCKIINKLLDGWMKSIHPPIL